MDEEGLKIVYDIIIYSKSIQNMSREIHDDVVKKFMGKGVPKELINQLEELVDDLEETINDVDATFFRLPKNSRFQEANKKLQSL